MRWDVGYDSHVFIGAVVPMIGWGGGGGQISTGSSLNASVVDNARKSEQDGRKSDSPGQRRRGGG